MKKILSLISIFCTFFTLSMILTACSFLGLEESICDHEFSMEWEYDDNHHWHPATCEHVDKKLDVENHIIDEYGTCSICYATFEGKISETGWRNIFADIDYHNFTANIVYYQSEKFQEANYQFDNGTFFYDGESDKFYIDIQDDMYIKYVKNGSDWKKQIIAESDYNSYNLNIDKISEIFLHLGDDYQKFTYLSSTGCYEVTNKDFILSTGISIYSAKYTVVFEYGQIKRLDAVFYTSQDFLENSKVKIQISFNDTTIILPLVSTDGLEYELCGTYYKVKGMGTATDTHIVIPSVYEGLEVKAIGEEAFANKYIKKLTLSDSIEYLENKAFYGCEDLSYIYMGKNLLEIGDEAFYGCYDKATIIMYDSIKRIGKMAFGWNASHAVKGDLYFYGDINNWVTVEFGDEGSNGLMNHNFYLNDELLKTIIIDTAEYVSSYAFIWNHTIRTITIGEQVTRIGTEAFDGYVWDYPLDVYYEGNLDQFLLVERGDCWLNWCSHNLYISGNLLTELDLSQKDIEIDYSFMLRCESIKRVVLPIELKRIEALAFCDCSNLVEILIPDSVEYIGWSALSGCGMENVKIGYGNECQLDNQVFAHCNNLKNVYIGAGITYLDETFYGCEKLENFIVDDNNNVFLSQDGVLYNKDKTILVQYPIAKMANCFIVPNSVKIIKNLAFHLSSISTIEFGANIETIEDYAFEYCENLNKLIFNCGNIAIAKDAFRGANIQEIYIGANAHFIDTEISNEHNEFTWLDNGIDGERFSLLNVSSENQYYTAKGGSLYSVDGTILLKYIPLNGETKYVCPKGVKIIAKYSFYFVGGLVEVVLKNDVVLVEKYAFYSCDQLKIVFLSNNIESIANCAFQDCDVLEKIYCEASEKPIGWEGNFYNQSPLVEVVWSYQE